MKNPGPLRSILLFVSLIGNLVLGLCLWSSEIWSHDEPAALEATAPVAWEARKKTKTLKRRILALEGRLAEFHDLKAKQSELDEAKAKNLENSKSAPSGQGSSELNDEAVAKTVMRLLNEMEFDHDRDDEEVVSIVGVVEADGTEHYETEGGGAVLNFGDDDDEIARLEAFLGKLMPLMSHKESVFRALLKVHLKSESSAKADLAFDAFNSIQEFLGGEETARELALEFLRDSAVPPRGKLRLIKMFDFSEGVGEQVALGVLQSLTTHSELAIRQEVYEELLSFHYPEKPSQFERLARDSSEDISIRSSGINGMDLHNKRQREYIMSLTRDRSKTIRHLAVVRLSYEATKDRIELFEELLAEENDWNVLYALATYLGSYGGRGALRALKALEAKMEWKEARAILKDYADQIEDRLRGE